MITQHIGDALPLGLQPHHVEVIAFTEQSLARHPRQQRIHPVAHPHIIDAVDRIRGIHRDLVSDLRLAGIFLVGHQLISGGSIEIAILVQQIACHLDTHVGVHRTDQHRLGRQLIEDPTAQFTLLVHEGIIYPQAEREGHTHRGATHEGVVGWIRQGGLHLLDG